MLRTLSLIWIGLWGACTVQACDICGCSVSTTYLGILPRYERHFIGLRYQYRAFQSSHPLLKPDDPPLRSRETYQTAEAWGRYVLGKRWQFYGILPLHDLQKVESGSESRNRGLGDVQVLAQYLLFNRPGTARWQQALQIGGGLKLPTGKSRSTPDLATANPSLLPGTGSWDVLVNALYTLRRGNWGLLSDLNYRINTEDRSGYRFGNKTSGGLRLFYWKELGDLTLLPVAGFQWEHSQADTQRYRVAEVQDYTGGSLGLLSGGIDLFFPSWSLGFQVRQPVVQQLGAGLIQAQTQVYAQANFLF